MGLLGLLPACAPPELDEAGEVPTPGGGGDAGGNDEDSGGVRLVDASETLPDDRPPAKRHTVVFVENLTSADLLLAWYDSDGAWDGEQYVVSGLPLGPGERDRIEVEGDTVRVQASDGEGACAQSPEYALSPGDVREWVVERLPGRDRGGMDCE